ncbi:histidine phosphatase family protein [Asaia siamensis]|uniref:Phosphoglycerate mutase n=1 Tax=Asaia siamensis TaxID=110479 RepID=A0ABQ1LZ52_9PROT|nr:histidine phosphatase family protein [Asaia siamensis]GBR02747.1 phosphoglycerate mutase [Asaia siamensis NRIC 0323]GGC30996.1 phosphoglycerate mutase [Asaia siamensis]
MGLEASFSVLLARHPPVLGTEGQCYGRRDVPLAPGWERFVTRWGGQGAVYASPAQRCQRAAVFLAGGAPVQTDARLLEMDFGAWEGQNWSAIPREALDDWAADPFGYQPGGGENVEALIARVTAFWRDLLSRAENCRVVTHGGPLRIMKALAENRAFQMEDPAPPQGETILLHFFNKNGAFVAQNPPLR